MNGKKKRRSPKRRRWLWPTIIAAVLVLGVVAIRLHNAATQADQTQPKAHALPPIGSAAPDEPFTSASGGQKTVASFKGKPALLWFVTTWCPSCQAGTQTMAKNIGTLRAEGVRVAELELYRDLGGHGPSIGQFRARYAGAAGGSPNWRWGQASKAMSYRYDPRGYLDIYYLLDKTGRIRYVNGSPADTMPDLLQQVRNMEAPEGKRFSIVQEGQRSGAKLFKSGDTASGGHGQTVDGVGVSQSEQVAYHVHALLTLYINGRQVAVPKGIGIVRPWQVQNGFITGGKAFYWLHTHDASGIIHIESPTKKRYTLGQFFAVWGEPLSATNLAGHHGKLHVFVDRKPYRGNPAKILLKDRETITLEVGKEVSPPRRELPASL